MKAVASQVLSRVAGICRRLRPTQVIARQCPAWTVFPLLFLSGCVGVTSTTLPPVALAATVGDFDDRHGPLTVGVKQFDQRAYSDSLIKTLRATHVFAEVAYLDELSGAPDLIAAVEEPASNTMVCPVPTLLTFGLIPTHTTETHGHVFSLQSPGNDNRKIVIDHRYQAITTIGWIALLKALSEEETLMHPERHDRYRENLRQVLLTRSPEIEALTRSQNSAAVH